MKRRHKLCQCTQPECHGTLLAQTATAQYLGMELDSQLSGAAQVSRTRSRVSAKLGALWRARPLVPQSIAKQYYQSVIVPDLLYASTAYYSLLSAGHRRDLAVLSNRSLRCVLNTHLLWFRFTFPEGYSQTSHQIHALHLRLSHRTTLQQKTQNPKRKPKRTSQLCQHAGRKIHEKAE